MAATKIQTDTHLEVEQGFDEIVVFFYDTLATAVETANRMIRSVDKQFPSSSFSVSTKSNEDKKSTTVVNKFSARPDVVAQYVQRMLDNDDLNIQWIPDLIETKIYSMVVELAINCCFSLLRPLDGLTVANHHIEMDLIKGTGIPMLPKDAIDTTNLNIIVDKMIHNPNLNAVWLPAVFKRDLFFHILYIFLSILQVFVGSTQCDVIGHTLAATIAKRPMKPKSPFQRLFSNISNVELDHYLDKSAASASRKEQKPGQGQGFIDKEYITTPDVTRSLYKIVYVMVLVIIEEVFDDFRLNLIGDAVRFNLKPGKQTLALSLAQELATVAQESESANEVNQTPTAGLTTKQDNDKGERSTTISTKDSSNSASTISNRSSSNSGGSSSGSSTSSSKVVDDTAKQTNKASSNKRLHTLLTERESLSTRLNCVQRQIIACEDEILKRVSSNSMSTQSNTPVKSDRSSTPVKTDRAHSNAPDKSDNSIGTPIAERIHIQSHNSRTISTLQTTYTDDGRSSSGVKRQAGRGMLHSLLRSPSSH